MHAAFLSEVLEGNLDYGISLLYLRPQFFKKFLSDTYGVKSFFSGEKSKKPCFYNISHFSFVKVSKASKMLDLRFNKIPFNYYGSACECIA